MMNTSEMIKMLQERDPSGNMDVEIAIGQFTKAFPVAYVKPFGIVQYVGAVRINCSLPEGVSTIRRKVA